jgi:hypothetical protein
MCGHVRFDGGVEKILISWESIVAKGIDLSKLAHDLVPLILGCHNWVLTVAGIVA